MLARNITTNDIQHTYLYTSTNHVIYPLKDRWIIFAPDSHGMPVVVGSEIQEILELFKHGAIVKDVVTLVESLSMNNEKQLLEIIDYLITYGYLKFNPKPLSLYKYSPSDDSIIIQSINQVEIWLHITNYCNLDCEYCFVKKSKNHMNNNIALEIIEKIISTAKIRKLKKINLKFAGGEPTLFVEKIKSFSRILSKSLKEIDVELRIAILSNGTVVTDELIDFIHEYNASISISLDGYREYHDIYRVYKNNKNKGSWKVVEKNINLLVNNKIYPYILATISEASSASLTELSKWVYSLGLNMHISVVREPQQINGQSASDVKLAYKNLCTNMIESFENLFQELESSQYQLDILKRISICELHFENPSFSTCCGIGASHLVIKQDGTMANCPMTLSEMAIPMENDMLISTRNTFPISALKRKDVDGPKCIDCTWFPVCTGGCPVNNQRNAGHYFAVSPLHDFYQYVIPRYINFYGYKLLQMAQTSHEENLIITY